MTIVVGCRSMIALRRMLNVSLWCVCSLLGLAPQSWLRQYWDPGTALPRQDAMHMNDTQRPFLQR